MPSWRRTTPSGLDRASAANLPTAEYRINGDGFDVAVDRVMDLLFGVKEEQNVAQQPEGSNDTGLLAGGSVFKQAGVFPPVVTVLYSAPAPPYELFPLLGRSGISLGDTDEDALFGFF